MTTIAYRDGVLAADTGATCGSSRNGAVSKIVRRADGAMAGAGGSASYTHAFLKWFVSGDGQAPDAKEDNNSMDSAVVFMTDGTIEVYEPRGSFTITAPYYAMGSGRPEALGAMFAGADAKRAVEAAMAHDAHTFGSITLLTHAEETKALRVVRNTKVD